MNVFAGRINISIETPLGLNGRNRSVVVDYFVVVAFSTASELPRRDGGNFLHVIKHGGNKPSFLHHGGCLSAPETLDCRTEKSTAAELILIEAVIAYHVGGFFQCSCIPDDA